MFSAAKTSGPSGAYALTKSLRFRASASAYLNRTYSSSQTNAQKGTYSFWIKRGQLGVRQVFLGAYDGSATSGMQFEFTVTDNLLIQIPITTQSSPQIITNAVYRDASAWYHIFVSCDTTQSTASNRVLIYVNGVQVTSFSTATYPTQNGNTQFGYPNSYNKLGSWWASSSLYLDGYMADVYYIDGQALAPTSFGAFSATTGVWQPIKYTGTYGTNGFHLAFTNTTSTTTLGYDTSGNGNNWTTNNISLTAGSTYDSMNDVPNVASATAANYAVWNPNDVYTSSLVLSNGNLSYSASSGFWGSRAAFGMTSGKWYWENTITTSTQLHGIMTSQSAAVGGNFYPGIDAYGWGYYGGNGNKYNNNSSSSYGATFTTGDVIGVAFDAGAGTLTFYKNGTSQGVAFTGLTNGPYFPAFGASAASGSTNFGQQPFTYTPPTGYVALNTYNLPTPAIVRGNQYMDASLWTGNGGTQAIMNAGSFQPDFVWVKSRSSASWANFLQDTNRGITEFLISNSTNAAGTTSPNIVNSVNSNGFSILSNGNSNNPNDTYVAWQWQAGKGSTSSNTNGSITSTVSVNQTAGFSIVTYTGNATAGATVGHGLGVAPSMVICKTRTGSTVGAWQVYHSALGATKAIFLNLVDNAYTNSVYWNNTAPTSSVFTLGSNTDGNGSGYTMVAYCFAQIDGFSSFGSYVGNGNSSGPFVYCGFKPRFVMVKCVTTVGGTAGDGWHMEDTARNTYNTLAYDLLASSDSSEAGIGTTNYYINFLSNGFQIATSINYINNSGTQFIYMAFASNPFKYSNAF